MSKYNGQLDCKVYVGGLTREASREEIERAFGHYGKLTNVFVARNPPGFAFVEYDDPQDASDAVRALDGRYICGVRARVELSHGKSRPKNFRRNNDYGSRRRRSRSGSRPRYDHRQRTHRERERMIERDSPRMNGRNENVASRSRSRSRS